MKLVSTNPARGYSKIGEVKISSKDEVVKKVAKANDAKKVWKELGLGNRVKLLRKFSEKLLENKEKIALLVTKEVGKPISQSRDDVDSPVHYFNWYLDNAHKYLSPEVVFKDKTAVHTVFYEPLGTNAAITPWNYPLSNFIWNAGQSLIVGNTVVYKASEECPLFGKLLEQIMNSCGLPEGVFSEVYGDGKVGEILVNQDIDIISFTGSSTVGKKLYKLAGEKFIKAVCELGGSAPGVVFKDADLDAAINGIYAYRFDNCGQTCDALKRLIVDKNVFKKVVDKLKTHLELVRIGDPEDEKTDIGPLVAKRQLELLEEQVKDAVKKGAKIITGGKRPKGLNGAYYEPTILTNLKPNMRVWQEEVFGPVLPIVSFNTEEQAIRMANDTKYGLGAYVYTNDKNKAEKFASKIEAGMVSVNSTSYCKPPSPFGGYKDSGIGREHGKFGFADLTQVKVVATNL